MVAEGQGPQVNVQVLPVICSFLGPLLNLEFQSHIWRKAKMQWWTNLVLQYQKVYSIVVSSH